MKPQLWIHKQKPDASLVRDVYNDESTEYRQKPYGGLWTSTYRPKTQDSAWVAWCLNNSYGNPYALTWTILTVQRDAKLYTIDSVADLSHCLWKYGYAAPHRHSAFGKRRVLDFPLLAQHFDGLHLTVRGNEKTHLSYPNDLNSWDSESVLWFRWCFSAVRVIPTPERKEEGVA